MSIEYVNDPLFVYPVKYPHNVYEGISSDEYMDALKAGYYRNKTALLQSDLCVNMHAHYAYLRIMTNPDADITPQVTWLEYIE